MKRVNSERTYSEIYEILNILGKEAIDKLPHKLYGLIEKEMDKEYKPNLLDENGLVDETKISQETIALFAVLNMKYFMQDEEEKKELLKIYRKNEENYQAELREKYNPDDIFKNRKIVNVNHTKSENQESVSLIKYEEDKWYEKIFNIIKKIFKRN